ncbi:MAG: hypothetical protein ACK5WF_17780, partial [Cyclobacteriaceae bacterium]
MAFRIILYFFLTLIFLVASVITIAIGGSGFIAFVWLIFCGLSIYGIYTTLTAYQRIKLSGTQLLVTKIIGANQTLYLEELHE